VSLTKATLVIQDAQAHGVAFDLQPLLDQLVAQKGGPSSPQFRAPPHVVYDLFATDKDLTAYIVVTQMQGNTAWQDRPIEQLGVYLMMRYGPPLTAEQIRQLQQPVVEKSEAPIRYSPTSSPMPIGLHVPPEPPFHSFGHNIPAPVAVNGPRTEPRDVSVAAHHAYEKKFEGKMNRKKGEFARFGWWDNGGCNGNDQWMCGGLTSHATGCKADFPACTSGKAIAADSYSGGNNNCVITWWKWVCE
jgi:hypothetical protein